MLKSTNADERYDACEELNLLSSLPEEAKLALQEVVHDPDIDVADAARRTISSHTVPPASQILPDSTQQLPTKSSKAVIYLGVIGIISGMAYPLVLNFYFLRILSTPLLLLSLVCAIGAVAKSSKLAAFFGILGANSWIFIQPLFGDVCSNGDAGGQAIPFLWLCIHMAGVFLIIVLSILTGCSAGVLGYHLGLRRFKSKITSRRVSIIGGFMGGFIISLIILALFIIYFD
jgi:hypothetical protein